MNTPQEVIQVRQRLGQYARVPQEQAISMPPPYYISPAWFDFEKEHLFRRQWNCIGHVAQIPHSGDYFTTDLIDEPLLVWRDQDHAVRIFSNVCRHRANIVARGSGNSRRFTCGYHAWTYGQDGRLLAAPLFEERVGFRKADYGLPLFHCELWKGLIFVNMSERPEPLAPSLQSLEQYIGNYHVDERQHVYQTDEVWNANWKSVIENFMEGYHLSILHAKTLHEMTPTALCEKIPATDSYTAYKSHFNPMYPDRGPFHPDLTLAERKYSVLFCAYPALLVGVAPNATIYLCLRPLSPESTAIRWGLTRVSSQTDIKIEQSYLNQIQAAFTEDRLELEAVQKGLKTRFYDHGPLAPPDFEGTVWDLIQYMAKQLGSDAALA
jgi:choline monooxygenase